MTLFLKSRHRKPILSRTREPPSSTLGERNCPLRPGRTAADDSFETGQLRRPEHGDIPWLTFHRMPVVRFGKIFDSQPFCRWKEKMNSPSPAGRVAHGSLSRRSSGPWVTAHGVGEGRVGQGEKRDRDVTTRGAG